MDGKCARCGHKDENHRKGKDEGPWTVRHECRVAMCTCANHVYAYAKKAVVMKRINVAKGLQFSFAPNLDGEKMIWVSCSYEGWTMKQRALLIRDLKKAIKAIESWK